MTAPLHNAFFTGVTGIGRIRLGTSIMHGVVLFIFREIAIHTGIGKRGEAGMCIRVCCVG